MPVGALASALLLVMREVAGLTLLDSLQGIDLLIASLELGYVTGLISTDLFPAAQSFRRFLARVPRSVSSRPTHKDDRLCLGRNFAPG